MEIDILWSVKFHNLIFRQIGTILLHLKVEYLLTETVQNLFFNSERTI